MTVVLRYQGPFEAGMVLTAPDNDGVLGFRRVKLIAEHPDGGWIYEDLPSRMVKLVGGRMGRCPGINLRVVFEPELRDPNVDAT